MSKRSVEVALAFVKAVNAGSVARLAGLMTQGHVFVDSDGTRTRGKAKILSGWGNYFALVPDYRIVVKKTFAAAGTVMMAGAAEGTFAQAGAIRPENHCQVPAAWRAVIRGGKVAVWQVYVNPEPMSAVLRRITSGC